MSGIARACGVLCALSGITHCTFSGDSGLRGTECLSNPAGLPVRRNKVDAPL